MIILADKFSSQPDPTMDPIAGACINRKRLLRKNATTHLVFALYFDELPDMDILRESFTKLFEIQRFACVSVPAPFAIESSWKKVENNIDHHLFHYHINSVEEGEAQIQKLVTGELRPLDVGTKPGWRVDLLQNSNGPSAVVWILDHSIGDGFGIFPIALKWATTLDDKPYDLGMMLSKNLVHAPKKPIVPLLLRVIPDLISVLKLPHSVFDSVCALTRNAERKTLEFDGKYEIVNFSCSFDDIVKIKDHAKTKMNKNLTVNDVLTASFGGALRKYLERKNDPILKSDILIRGQVPVANMKRNPGEIRNDFFFAIFQFPVGGKTPQERLLMAHEEFHELKNSPKIPIIQTVVGLGLRLGLDAMLSDTNDRQTHRTTFIFSNVPGPKEMIKAFGKKLLYFRPYFKNIIHQIIAITYAGQLNVSMVLDTRNITDPHLIGECFQEELKEMLQI